MTDGQAAGIMAATDVQIIAALPLRQRAGLYIDRSIPTVIGGAPAILESDGTDESAGFVGLACPNDDGGWYLGCIKCAAEISEEDSGMCRLCRGDLAREDALMHEAYQLPRFGEDREL